MRRQTVNRFCPMIWILFIFLILTIPSNSLEKSEESKTERAFYAISSLRFHVEELTEEISSERTLNDSLIEFEDHHITQLWELASLDPFVLPQLDQAQKYYYQAKNETITEQAIELYIKSNEVLTNIWEELDAYLIPKIVHSNAPTKKLTFHNFPECSHSKSKKKPLKYSSLQQKINPYLIPSDHPAKKALDSIFSKSSVTQNEKALAKAGFITISVRPYSFAVIVKHPDLPGYLQKLYLDSESRKKNGKEGWEWLIMRCEGAENIRQLIKNKKIRYFSVPDKWIYPIPDFEKSNQNGQPILLVVSDMNLVSDAESKEAWKSKISCEHLDELYIIISHGFASSHVSWNIPYTKDGKFSCIDTEHPKRKPNYKEIENYLSEEMKRYWKTLVKTGGIPKK